MYLDAFTISALVDEFMDTFVGGRIQDSLSVDSTGLGLEIYANHYRHYLYLSADQHTPRVHVVDNKLRRGVITPTQLALLIRRYVEGGILSHVSQPAWERVIQFDIEGPEGEVSLIVEPMERRSNLLLVREGVILDCLHRVGPEENRYRLSLPGHEYVPPPPQVGKRDPLKITLEDMVGFFQQNDDPKRKIQQVLASKLLGISPLLAKEIVFRAQEDTNLKAGEANPEKLLDALQAVVTPLGKRDWNPGVVETDEEGVTAFSVYPIKHLRGWRPVDTISEALTLYYGAPTGDEAYTAAKEPVKAAIQEGRAKFSAKLASLQKSMTDDEDRELLKQSGELILAYQYALQPDQTELRAQYDLDKPELVIKLDPTLSPLENAQRYFDRYNRAKRALDDVPKLIEETEHELAYLRQLETDLELAANWPEIDEVQQVLQSKGFWRGKTGRRIGGGGQSAPLRVSAGDGFVIWVGRNSRQNELVTFKKASGDDLWLHARDVPGAHVIIKYDGRTIPEEVINEAAALAAYYSALRREGKVPVDVTRVKHVRKIKGAAPGMVTYRNETTRLTVPQDVTRK